MDEASSVDCATEHHFFSDMTSKLLLIKIKLKQKFTMSILESL